MTHQFGDHYVQIGGQSVRLRLTPGALALLSLRLGITGPKGLARRLRSLSREHARSMLGCLVHPYDSAGRRVNDSPDVLISDTELTAALPVICTLFEEAFLGQK